MKRSSLPLIVAFLAVISSCEKREEITDEKQPIRFHANMEMVLTDSETRAFINEQNQVFWNENDLVTIFSETTYNKKFIYTGRTGTTSGDFDPVTTDAWNTEVSLNTGFNYSIYPYHRHNACDYDGNLTVPFPTTVTFEKNSRGIGVSPVMVARAETRDFMYMHAAGYVGLRLYGEGVSVASISMTSNNNKPLSGYPLVIFTDDAEPILDFNDDPDDSPNVTINYPEPIALGATAKEAKTFWFTLPPTVLTNGFTLTVKDSNGDEFTKARYASYVVERRKLKTIGPLEIVMDSTPVTVTGVELNKSEIELAVNETEPLTATVLPENATDKTVSWSSSNTNVATVSSNGVVTAVSPGTAVITVTTNTGGKTATCVVTVKEDAPVITYSLAIDPESAEIKYGETKAFTLTLTTTTNGVATTETVTGATWTTSDANVATVADGTATGTGAGTATITAKFTP